MKCDKLENKDYNNGMTAYELMEANGLIDTAKTVKDAIAELKAENERLVKDNERIKRLNEIVHNELVSKKWVDYNRRLTLRALWLARAQRANEHYHRYHGKFLCPLEDIPEYVKWKQVERKCRAKAKAYK